MTRRGSYSPPKEHKNGDGIFTAKVAGGLPLQYDVVKLKAFKQ